MFGHSDDEDNEQHDDASLPSVTNNSSNTPPMADGTLDDTSNSATDNSDNDGFGSQDDHSQPSEDSNDSGAVDNLISVKQQVLQDLHPLINHLDQSPEEKFKTLMMMIQASDDKSLVQSAYDAAKSITDEKVRAQALLDVVNEINYFTQPKS